MEIAKGLEMLEIRGNMNGTSGVFHPVLIWDDSEVILIDAGLPGQREIIKEAVEKAGVIFDNISRIIITHQDMDHIGSLSSIVKEASKPAKVYCHGDEKPYIQGELTPIKMTAERKVQMEKMFNQMPEEKRNIMKKMFSNISTEVDNTVEDGEMLPFCGGIEVIHTPGHTPGHICLYLNKYKTLVTGDALNVVEGKLCGPKPEYTYNMEESLNSLKKLVKYDIDTVICYHGGIYNENANKKIQELLNL